WLEANHDTAGRIRLVYFKGRSGKPSVSYDEAVEEALCFGWIDSRINSIDDERYMQLYTPRKPGSIWSQLNKQRVDKAVAEGRMAPAGQAKIDAAKADGSWTILDQVDSMAVPGDLARALESIPDARVCFDAYSDSLKKRTLYHLISAKRSETRAKRIAEIAELAGEGKSLDDRYRIGGKGV
ncbi:MAG: YdeI/OmpD-associated family protein, partial [Spirochaetaceae bacterium]|nr:YdeI/OmpD-associated family protein [Spirochaetaceae bacterium]